jgi:hypothetical protein
LGEFRIWDFGFRIADWGVCGNCFIHGEMGYRIRLS